MIGVFLHAVVTSVALVDWGFTVKNSGGGSALMPGVHVEEDLPRSDGNLGDLTIEDDAAGVKCRVMGTHRTKLNQAFFDVPNSECCRLVAAPCVVGQ